MTLFSTASFDLAKLLPVLLIAAASWVGYKVWQGKQQHHHHETQAGAAKLNEAFTEQQGVPPEDFQLVAEHKGRELAARSAELLDALPLKSGFAVADVGAGTGLFMQGLAQRVGATGKVFSLEVNPSYVEFLKKRAAKLRESKSVAAEIEVVQSSQQGVPLPANSINFALFADVFHHFEDQAGMLATVRRALKPGGFVTIIETEWPTLDSNNAQECHGNQRAHSHSHGHSHGHNHGHGHESQHQQHQQQHSHAGGHDHGHSTPAASAGATAEQKEVMKLWHSILDKHKLTHFHQKAHTHRRPTKEEIIHDMQAAGFAFQRELTLLKQSFVLVFVKN